MQIECRLFGPFRDDVGEKTVLLETDAGTYRELLLELEERYPVLEGRLVDGDADEIAGETVVTKNAKNIRHLASLDTPVEEGDVVRTTPAVYGG